MYHVVLYSHTETEARKTNKKSLGPTRRELSVFAPVSFLICANDTKNGSSFVQTNL